MINRGEHGWDNPGQPGKGGLKLVQSSPLTASNRGWQAYVTSSSGRCRNRSVLRLRSCAARRDQKPRKSRVRRTGSFDPCAHAVSPEG